MGKPLPYDPRPIHQAYHFLYDIGHGTFGSVAAIQHAQTGQMFACKTVLKSDPELRTQVLSEVQIIHHLAPSALHDIRDLPISTLHAIHEDQDCVYLVMELCTGGNLLQLLQHRKRLTEMEAALVVKQVAQALQYCNDRMVMHRDIKPENVCFLRKSDLSSVRLIDFGLATRMHASQQRFRQRAGTRLYMAPEMLQRRQYSKQADVWSLGVVLYAILSGRLPFTESNSKRCTINYHNLDLASPPWHTVSPLAKELIRGMLCPEEDERLTVTEVLDRGFNTGQSFCQATKVVLSHSNNIIGVISKMLSTNTDTLVACLNFDSPHSFRRTLSYRGCLAVKN